MAGQAHGQAVEATSEDLGKELVASRDDIRKHVARLYGQGFRRAQIARICVKHLTANHERPLEQQLIAARSKLRRWEADPKFRDMVYATAVVELDLKTPGILKGLASKAARGRVDAARLVLELTGRHAPKGETGSPNIVIAVNGVPRPQIDVGSYELIEGEAEEVED